MKLVVVHSHFRPGGVRRVIELATPALADAWRPRIDDVILVGGEMPDDTWLESFERRVRGVRVRCAIEPALGYWSEQRGRRPEVIARRIDAHLAEVLGSADGDASLVWAHNPGLGRNLPLAHALDRTCAARDIPLVFHHHDWWFDNRWARWTEMRAAGFRTLESVAAAILPSGAHVRHATINRADAAVLERHFPRQAGWVPNLTDPAPRVPDSEVARARCWLSAELGDDAPVWLMPCRLLRRKNIAEALLLARWLRPEAWLVTTGGVSSAEEQAYATALDRAARRHGWRLRLGVLGGGESGKPSVTSLVAASEAVLLTSLAEGFGLPYIEAAAAGRPLLARTLPNIAPDLRKFGFRFPQSYAEVEVAPVLFDQRAELRRQAVRWQTWQRQIPAGCRPLAEKSAWLRERSWPDAVPFSRLTLTAQLEVLARPAAESWAACAPFNPWLGGWRERAALGGLAVSPWPSGSTCWLGGAAYARAMRRLVQVKPQRATSGGASVRAQREFIRAKLAAGNQYPLLWSPEP